MMMMMMMMMMVMSIFIAHRSIILNAQCAEECVCVGGGGGGGIKSHTKLKKKRKKTHGAKPFTEQVRFQTSADAARESASLIASCRALQSSGTELEKALKPDRKPLAMDVRSMRSEGYGEGYRHCFGGRRKRNVMPKRKQ